jgi:hypothetical protein
MRGFAEFVRGVVEEGCARLREPPRLASDEREEALALLAAAYRDHRLSVAGPPIDFAPEPALAACAVTAWACWFLVHRDEPAAEAERALVLPPPPRTPAEHLSTDVTFRFLPAVHRRARALEPRDVLTTRLEELFRIWPLSGVLSDLDEGPAAVDFAGHRGLCLLYAERLAANPRPGWVVQGEVREYVELVFAETGRGLPS